MTKPTITLPRSLVDEVATKRWRQLLPEMGGGYRAQTEAALNAAMAFIRTQGLWFEFVRSVEQQLIDAGKITEE